MVLKFYPVLELWGDAIIVYGEERYESLLVISLHPAIWIWVLGHVGLAIYTTGEFQKWVQISNIMLLDVRWMNYQTFTQNHTKNQKFIYIDRENIKFYIYIYKILRKCFLLNKK